MKLVAKMEQLRARLTEAQSVGDAQKAVMQSKIEGLEQQLSSDSRDVAQKDLAIMELSQSLRRVDQPFSPRGGFDLPVQTPGATPMVSNPSAAAFSSYSYSAMKPYAASASSKLASMRSNNVAASVPRKVHIHRSGSVTIGSATQDLSDAGKKSPRSIHISRSGSEVVTGSAGIQSLHERLRNVQATFAKLKSSKPAK